jgi:iron complex transport system ATP-binding protein
MTYTDTAIEVQALRVDYDGHRAVDDLSLAIPTGRITALLGPNGAGKSTILSLAGAVVHPTAGTVHVLGHRLGRVELQALRRHVGHVNPRHPLRSPLSVTEVVLTGLTGSIETAMRWSPTPAQRDRARELIDLFGLGHRVDDQWPTLSQGERGRALGQGQRELAVLEAALGVGNAKQLHRFGPLATIQGVASTLDGGSGRLRRCRAGHGDRCAR